MNECDSDLTYWHLTFGVCQIGIYFWDFWELLGNYLGFVTHTDPVLDLELYYYTKVRDILADQGAEDIGKT